MENCTVMHKEIINREAGIWMAWKLYSYVHIRIYVYSIDIGHFNDLKSKYNCTVMDKKIINK